MKPFKDLTASENKALLKFSAYISLLAVNSDNKLDEAEIKSAIEFSHIKKYSCDPLLTDFYSQSDKVFETNIDSLNKELLEGKEGRDAVLKNELNEIQTIVSKLTKEYVTVMYGSMKSFKRHISHAHHNVLEDFLFPLPIKGLTY